MSESVTILINAEDNASATLTSVGNNVDSLGKRVKQTGGQLKGSAELAGVFARSLGNNALGSFAGELAQVTEKIGAFSEVSKAGAAGALAFKVGLAGAAGIASFKVGEAIGNWYFETERWKKELVAATTEAERLDNILAQRQQKAFAQAREDIGLVRDPGEREQATEQRIAELEKELAGKDAAITRGRAEVAERSKNKDAAWFKGNAEAELKLAEQQLQSLLKSKDALKAERDALADTVSERAKSIKAKKAENALADKSDAFIKSLREENELLRATKEEQLKLEAARNVTPENRGIAEELLKEREQLKARVEEQKKAEQEADLAARKEQDAIARTAELEKKRMVDLEARRIELEKGREAAAAYRLEQEGLSRATAERLAAAEEQQRQAEDMAGKAKSMEPDTSPQTALQGRLLRGGTGGDPALQLAQKQLATLEKLNGDLGKKLDDVSKAMRERGFTVKTAIVP